MLQHSSTIVHLNDCLQLRSIMNFTKKKINEDAHRHMELNKK